MTKPWQKLTSLPEGVTISGMSAANDSSALWLCSPAGLFCEKNGLFVQQAHGIPFQGASAVFAVGKHVLAAGHSDSIVHSFDGGNAWFGSRVEQIASVVTCFVASPDFDRDAVVLAGSDGDGVLRSTDGGNSWQLSNFGLRSLHILALACAPVWQREPALGNVIYNYEVVFAATEQGVYLSPNAGRAWQFAGQGLPDAPVLSLAVSPDFKRTPSLSGPHFNGAVFAGMDGAGLHRSQDGGQNWRALAGFPAQATVNALLLDSRGRLLAGTGEHGLLASSDLGETWLSLLETEDVILCLAEHGHRLLAGTAENGLLACEG